MHGLTRVWPLIDRTRQWCSQHFPATFAKVVRAIVWRKDGKPAIAKSHVWQTDPGRKSVRSYLPGRVPRTAQLYGDGHTCIPGGSVANFAQRGPRTRSSCQSPSMAPGALLTPKGIFPLKSFANLSFTVLPGYRTKWAQSREILTAEAQRMTIRKEINALIFNSLKKWLSLPLTIVNNPPLNFCVR